MNEHCDCQGCSCGCCEGIEPVTPEPIANPPGLDALAYRAGTHASFLETMKARLSGSDLPALAGLTTRDSSDPAIALLDSWATVADVLTFYQERIANEGYLRTATERRSVLELARLIGYEPRPGVAASVYAAFALEAGYEAEVPAGTRIQSVPAPEELPQTFETAEPLLARGDWNELPVRLTRPQALAPGKLAAGGTVYFQGVATNLKANDALLFDYGVARELHRVREVEAQTEAGRTRVAVEPWLLPAGKTAREKVLEALDRFRDPKLSPSPESKMTRNVHDLLGRFREGVATEELAGAELRRRLEGDLLPQLRAQHELATERGYALLAPWTRKLVVELDAAVQDVPASPSRQLKQTAGVSSLLDDLAKPASIPPRSSEHLARSVEQAFAPGSDLAPKLLTVARPELAGKLYQAWANVPVTQQARLQVYALRLRASVFAHNAPLEPVRNLQTGIVTGAREWTLEKTVDSDTVTIGNAAAPTSSRFVPTEKAKQVWLDAAYPQVLPGSWIALERPVERGGIGPLVITRAVAVYERSRAEYGITGKATLVELGTEWLHLESIVSEGPEGETGFDGFDVIRGTGVLAQSELLELAEEPIDPVLEPVAGDTVELASLVDGLEPGRWLAITGERTDVAVPVARRQAGGEGGESVRVPGVQARELAMLAGVEQVYDSRLAGDRVHTRIRLATSLAYRYRRDTVVLYGNVARATHGETGSEALGSGDAARSLQRFTLRRKPLTWVSARTPSGVEDTLDVRVDGVLWRRAGSLAELGPADRAYFVRAGDDGLTSVILGNGEHGARPSTGVENVTAVYRAGIGKAGNVVAGQISLLATRPLGVTGVINPLPASGGADPETRDQARRNAPLAVMALDRLVSVADYADFARTFAGVGKASAARLTDGRVELVHVTIAGVDDEPVLETSDLYQNLEEALSAFGDPRLPVRLAVREAALLVLSARVKVVPELLWEQVEPLARARLVDLLGFDRRELGQDVLLSEVVAALQAVRGVDYVDVDVLWRVRPEDLEKLVSLRPGGLAIPQLPGGQPAISFRRRRGALPAQPPERLAAELARVERKRGRTILRPAQILYLSPEAPDTLILQEITT